jgi:glycosyltransferase involved in cell wall biosynthesis
MNIAIIVPTRKRSKAVTELVETIVNTADDFSKIEILFYIDPDDVESEKCILELTSTYGNNIKYTSSRENLNLSQMWNYAYDKLNTSDIIMLCGDDIRFRTNSWDTIVRNEFLQVDDKILLVYGDDKHHGINHATHSFVHKRWIEASGFWLPPYFCADYVDTWLFEVATQISRIKYLPNVVTEHMHFSLGKSAFDETTERKSAAANKEHPARIYEQTHDERCDHADKLLQHIKNSQLPQC